MLVKESKNQNSLTLFFHMTRVPDKYIKLRTVFNFLYIYKSFMAARVRAVIMSIV